MHYDDVMIYKLHENEYGKVRGEFYGDSKNIIKANLMFDVSSKIEHDKIGVLVESRKSEGYSRQNCSM